MAATFNDIIKKIEQVVNRLNRSLPSTEKALYDTIVDELKRLDTSNGKIKTTVKNLSVIDSIQKKLTGIILNKDYVGDVKEYAKGFNEITNMQNQYWKNAESEFKPRALLKAIKVQAINNTVNGLAGAGIGAKIAEPITQILRTNITAGGSYADLTEQLRGLIKQTNTPGILDKNIKQVALDALNQYSAQYNQVVSSDLGFQWYSWQGSEVYHSRGFCQALAERHRYFHVSGIPNLLEGKDESGNPLRYIDNKTNEEKEVTLNPTTKLPNGFYAGTTPENFLIRRGGYNCGHQPRPVSEDLVKYQDAALYDKIINSPTYRSWLQSTTGKAAPTAKKAPPESPISPQAAKPAPVKMETVLEARQEPDNKKAIPSVKIKGDHNFSEEKLNEIKLHAQNELMKLNIKEDIDIIFSKGKKGLSGHVELGENPEKIKSITVSNDSSKPVNKIISHELTHVEQINNNRLFVQDGFIMFDGQKVMSVKDYVKKFSGNSAKWSTKKLQDYYKLPWETPAFKRENGVIETTAPLPPKAPIIPSETFIRNNEYNRRQIENSTKWREAQPHLSLDQKGALNGYTGSDYSELNGFLFNLNRNAASKDLSDREKFLVEYRDILNETLRSLKNSDFVGTTYRGANVNSEKLKKYSESVGKVITEPGFMSTAYDSKNAFGGNSFFTVKGKSGKYVRDLGQYGDAEKEVLFPAGTKFKVLSYTQANGRNYIELEEQ